MTNSPKITGPTSGRWWAPRRVPRSVFVHSPAFEGTIHGWGTKREGCSQVYLRSITIAKPFFFPPDLNYEGRERGRHDERCNEW